MAGPSGQVGSSMNNPMQIIGQGVQPAQQPGGQPWMQEYTQPMQGGWGPPGGGGGGGGGSAGGNYASYKSGGFGMMPSGAGPLAEALQSASYRGPGTVYGEAAGMPQTDWTGKAGASASAVRHGEEMEQQQRDQFSQQQQMGNIKMQMMQKLMSLFGAQGMMGAGGAGGAQIGMPVGIDPKIQEAQKADINAAYEP